MKRMALLVMVGACFGDNGSPAVDARPTADAKADASEDLPDALPGAVSLRITEINPAGTTDLIELVAVTGGALDGIKLEELTNSDFDYTFPAGYTVATNDVILLHLAGTCTDQVGDAASCGTAAPFTAAWDFSMPGNLSYSGKVFELTSTGGARMDAVAFVESGGLAPAGYVAAVQLIQSRSAWDPTPCIHDPATGMAKDRYCRNISVIWDALEDDNSNSVTRIVGAEPLTVPGSRAQWTAALPASFGTYD
ncbi:MAG: hypothetical protein WKG01_07575 [Kofleriaceae bacterium]